MPREAEELFDLLRCQQCHVLDTIPADQPPDNLAPDLRMARERLQPDWIVDWLRAPLEIQPGTRMPMFWAEFSGFAVPAARQRWAAATGGDSGLPADVRGRTVAHSGQLIPRRGRP